MNNFSTWLTLVMLAIFTTMVAIAAQYPEGAALMPYVVGIPGIGLCLLQLALDYRRATGMSSQRFRLAPKAGKPEGLPLEEPELGPQTAKREALIWFYFIAFIAGILLFGFYVAVPVLLITFLRREADTSVRFAFLLGGGGAIMMFLIFGMLLHLRLYPGYISPAILRVLGL
ncbi:MAG TPA: tripartite tricarboxylate transporter TctB family protein [Nordella sp.]|nr:tripartite tricarboxylate transporter TctB family protein [Nordella sp.]